MGSAASSGGAKPAAEVTDAALIIIDQLKSVPIEDRKNLLSQLALIMGGDANGDGSLMKKN